MPRFATKFAPTAEAFETAWQAGFRHAEFWLNADLCREWSEIAARADRYEMTYAMHCPNKANLDDAALDGLVALRTAIDASAVIIHRPMYDRYADALRDRDPAIPLAVENHRLTPDEFEHWAETFPGLTLDVEHVWKFTLHDAPLDSLWSIVDRFLERHSPKLRHVHLPGYEPGEDEHRPLYCSPQLAAGMWARLEHAGFSGLVVSEIDASFQTLPDLEQDVAAFQKWSRP